jgi:ATP-dependent helicase/nuclease subunit B
VYNRLLWMQCGAGRAYNAGMGTISASELDAWLSAGGLVVTGSERAARAMLRAYHRARQSEGRTAWLAPSVTHWQSFVRSAWEKRARDGRLALSPQQELLLWRRIVGASGLPASLLDGPRRKLAGLAMEAHALICAYAPQYLDARRRAGWDQDAATWSGWLEEFDAACRDRAAVSAERVALEMPSLLDAREQRPPLVLAGFDRLTPSQLGVLNAWGEWRQVTAGEPAKSVAFYRAADASTELAACAAWCRQILEAGPERRVLVITQNVAEQRGEMERAFLRENERGADLRFEFSLGIPLRQAPVARSAEMLLRWLDGVLEEQELDWLIASGHTVASARETAELAAAMRTIRKQKRQRVQWSLRTFAAESAPLARAWAGRMMSAQERLAAAAARERSHFEWAEVASHLLETAGWPGGQPQTSGEFQAARRWSQVVEACGSLGFDGQRVGWSDFFAELRAALDETLFALESEDAPIVIAGPAESAGLEADAIWFLGANENAWPACGTINPLLPATLQREARMPHASPALDWELAQVVTERLLRSAREVRFSYSAQMDGADARPSRLIRQLAAAVSQKMPDELVAAPAAEPLAIAFEDATQVPLELAGEDGARELTTVHGGASVITAQSNCPFQAFATARLQAETWDPAEAGLTAAERGELVHAVLHSVWGGPETRGLRSLAELRAVGDLGAFVAGHVRNSMADIPRRVREQMPAPYLALEEQRLTRLITTWLEYERMRAEFEVAQTELAKPVIIAGLALKLRLDRLDRLNDGTFLVVDYKTGRVADRAWNLPRPEDLQLPLYAGFGLDDSQIAGGLVYAKVQTGKEMGFAGSVGNALETLLPGLGRTCALVRRPFEAEQLMEWREEIEKLAHDFLAGRADVDPRDPPKTCERCGLHVLCRIQEREPAFAGDEAAEEDADA